MSNIKGFISHVKNTLGPGLLFSGAAIGVSHLVMSTQAGATYGLSMLLFVLIAHIFKYPFFQFGPRYAAATGSDLLDGYNRLGKVYLLLFLGFTLATFFIFLAAVTIVTSGLALVLLDLNMSVLLMSVCVLLFCAAILSLGHYHYLVKIVKVIIIALTLSTIVAFFYSFSIKWSNGFNIKTQFIFPDLSSDISVTFLIALMGWMPAPIELSIWHSIWQLEKKKDDPSAGSVSGSLIDFNVGYYGTAIIAMLFVGLGSLMFFGQQQSFPSDAVGFSKQLIFMYTNSLGDWAWWVIAIAAFTTMFSTTLTLLDAYARVITKSLSLLFKNYDNNNCNYNIWLAVCICGALAVLWQYMHNMKLLTMFATILSFLTAPFFAWLNYKVITDSHMPIQHRIGYSLKIMSYVGMTLLVLVSLWYVVKLIF